ncbi:MAG TPA: CHAT domain-containing protein [Thermoanaerobaculia bacterium]|jgi:CHAT domain-containing protein|nr:CHAT domain-containing protein [Thermoanaerobaculia bacterium]
MLRALPLLIALAAPSPTAAPAALPSFNRCEQLAASEPESEATGRCFVETGDALKQADKAKARLQELLREHPGSPWLTYFLVYRGTDPAVLSRLAASFASRRDAGGEVSSRVNLYRLLFNAGRVDEAGVEVDRTVQASQASGDPELIARAQVLKARHLWGTGKDLEGAYLLLRQAKPALFPNGPYPAQKECLLAMANLDLELGHYQEGLEAFRRMAELAATKRDLYTEANARYGLVRAVFDHIAELPSEEGRREVARLAQQALDAAVAAQSATLLAKMHLTLGILSKGETARSHFDSCLAAATTPGDQSYCLDGLARFLSITDPRAAQKAIDRSLELARQAQDAWSLAFAWREQMRVSWAAGRAIEGSRSALDAIEAMRDLQAGSSGKAEAFSTWSEDYYWLSGRLIDAGLKEKKPENLEQAFQISERLRARSLIDTLEAAHAVPAAAAPLRQKRGTALERISAVQRRLLDPALPAPDRAAASQELERLEIEEADLRNQLARTAPALQVSRRPKFATLARVRQALAADEAFLSFQISSWEDERGDFAGGSWLLVTTRGGTRAYRLPGRGELRPAVRLFNGTFDRRDDSEAAPAAGLYRRLLEQPLRELPPGIRRLILVPDDALHQLPFAALRSGPKAPPLATRYELMEVPSATLWLSWKGRRPAVAPIPALALADPPLPGGDSGVQLAAARERAAVAVFASGVRLGPLPYARAESRSVVRDLGGGSVQRLGEDASEVFVKTTPLQQFGVLHFATHAVTDETNPDRSGVLLAPGAANQDGLLQIREIVDLGLDGRVVVLSACSSNTGALLRGEGVMSLARAFFQAGAHTVVASLWRLRDDEAAELFDRFYRHLGKGLSVAAALRSAQRDMIAAGAPAAAWAGLVVLGDGGLVPLPGGRKGIAVPVWVWVAGGLLALALMALLLGRTGTNTDEHGPTRTNRN